MSPFLQQCAHQRRLARAQIAFQIDDEAGEQRRRQRSAQIFGGGCIGQYAFPDTLRVMLHVDSFSNDRVAALKTWAAELGFSGLGVSRAEIPTEAIARLNVWLAEGQHGSMDYMARHASLRVCPDALMPGVCTVISVMLDYWPETLEASHAALASPERAYVSRYALGRDYHRVMRQRLEKLATRMTAEFGPFRYRAFADSAPVLETEFATRAGLGWTGKHTLLLSRQGSLRFLGELYTDLSLPPTPAASGEGHCGRCHACLDICPTRAIVAPRVLDARRCISYLTIELDGPIPEPLRAPIGNRIYGCDDCQLACPWNRFSRPGDSAFSPRAGLDQAGLLELFAWNAAEFEKRLEGSPIRRIGFERWQRNLSVALGNAAAQLPVPKREKIRAALWQKRAAGTTALVAEHLDWALQRAGETGSRPP